MKKVLALIGWLLAAIAIVFFLPFGTKNAVTFASAEESTQGIFPQQVAQTLTQPITIEKIYNQGELIGVLTDQQALEDFLKKVYQEDYSEQFPNSSIGLGTDIYITQEQSYFEYEDIDTQIFDYLRSNELFSVKVTAIEFADENAVYAEIYVSNREIYDQAMQTYLSFFVDEETLARLTAGGEIPELKTYGNQVVGVSISQTITVTDAYANPEVIKTTEQEVLEYLEYGDNTERTYYTVKKYDTVGGVGSKNFGLTATQVMNINRDKITSVDQVLSEGEVLCVTYFTSPIDIVVTQQSMKKEPIYPETIYEEDDSIRVGQNETIQEGVEGSKNTLYTERWINGVLVNGTVVSSVDTLQPQNEIVAVGTLEIPGVGTGQFRWPVDNHYISCYWLCYAGHQAIDIQNAYDHYGNIYAADRGIVVTNTYDGISGNYVVIDHGNGWTSYYGHMNVPSPVAVGTVVEKGDIIGQLGMTGRATGPHTHFYIADYDGVKYNPCEGFLDCTQ